MEFAKNVKIVKPFTSATNVVNVEGNSKMDSSSIQVELPRKIGVKNDWQIVWVISTRRTKRYFAWVCCIYIDMVITSLNNMAYDSNR